MTYEYQVDINGVMHAQKNLAAVHITHELFDKMSVGNAVAAELDLTYWPLNELTDTVKIIPYIREVGAAAWSPLGVFWMDTSEAQGSKTHIIAYDVMPMSEQFWTPDQSLEFPVSMEAAAREIARLIGTSLDPRCVFNNAYTVDYPADRTMREVLCDIAGAHLGNWIATAEGKLLLVPLFDSMPPETHYLIDEHGSAITFGGTRILI